MLKNEPKQLSLYSILYNRIPKNHILKRITSVVDFSFINEMLEISVNTTELYEYSQWTKTQEFKDKYKKRASNESKNGKMKRFHGLTVQEGTV